MLPCLAVIIINDISTVIFDRSFCIEHIPWDVKYIYQIQDKRTFDYLQICNSKPKQQSYYDEAYIDSSSSLFLVEIHFAVSQLKIHRIYS